MFGSTGSVVLVVLIASLAASGTRCAAETSTGPPLVVVELFTSEGCSSCPPADRVLAELVRPNAVEGVRIVPLSLHVDYWNDLGWTDPFSSALFSERQQRYAHIFNANEVYTPQMIVDGTVSLVGSDWHKVLAAIKSAAGMETIAIALTPDPKNPKAVSVNLKVTGIHLDTDMPAQLMLAITEDDLSSDVIRGENAGHALHHTAVVRILRQIATIHSADPLPFSASTQISLRPNWRANHLHVAAFVQNPQNGKMLAAGYEPFPARPQ